MCDMTKPKKPTEPVLMNYPIPEKPTGVNYAGEPIYQNLDFIRDYKKYLKDIDNYNSEIEIYEQVKLIKLIKNSTEKYCLKKLKITKR